MRIQVDGAKQLRGALRQMAAGSQKELRPAYNKAAQIVVEDVRRQVPKRSGRARGSVRSRSTQTAAIVRAGGKRVPYYGWLDFGGRVGRRKAVLRPFREEGRYLYPTIGRRRRELIAVIADELEKVARRARLK